MLGGLVFGLARRYERQRMEARFEEFLARETTLLEKEIHACLEALHSLRAFFDSSDLVTRQEFATFTAETRRRHPAIQALEWVARVPSPEREAYETRLRREGLSVGRIRERGPDGAMRPASSREVHYPVTFVEPLVGNEEAVGYDLASEPVRRLSLERALASGACVVTAPIRLVQERRLSYAVLALLAVYEAPDSAEGPSESAAAGLVVAVLRIEGLLAETLLAASAPGAALMRFTLLDPDTGDGGVVLRPATTSPGEAEGPGFRAERVIELGGRTWRLRANPTEAFLARHRSAQPLLTGIVVFLVFALAFVALLVFGRRVRDRALHREARKVQSVLRSLDEGVIVADRHGRVEMANEAASGLVGPLDAGVFLADSSAARGCYLPDRKTPYPSDRFPLARAIHEERVDPEDIFVRNGQAADGRWVRVSGAPLVDESLGVQGGVVVLRDVTERRKREEELQRLSNAVEQTADAVVITDRDGRILYVNPAFEQITGYARQEVLGSTPRILRSGHHAPAFYRKLWSDILEGGVFRGTIVNRKKSGDLFYGLQTITPMRDERGEVTHFVSVLKDMTEERRREAQEAELRLAATVQRHMFPGDPPRLAGLDIAGRVDAAEATSGDYYDFLGLPDGALALVIADISGHGFGPALLMAETRAYLRSLLLRADASPEVVLTRLNATLVQDLPDDRFVTLLLAKIDPRARLLVGGNAGHPPGFLLDRDGNLKAELRGTGMALGIMAQEAYEGSPPLRLEEGDVLVLLTDGLTEARDEHGAFFDVEGVLEAVRAHRHASAREILDRVFEAARAFAGGKPADDDQTMIVCKVTSRDEGRP